MVNSWGFKGDESESEVKTNSGPRVCTLLVEGPHFACVQHAQCPFLNICDFFLWGYLKDRVFANSPNTFEELEAEILLVMQDVPEGVYELAVRNFVIRLGRMIKVQGGHFENRDWLKKLPHFVD